jgi:hypothetical protein
VRHFSGPYLAGPYEVGALASDFSGPGHMCVMGRLCGSSNAVDNALLLQLTTASCTG